MSDQVSVEVRRRALCGEGPVWHQPTNEVLWVDIVSGEILRTNATTGTTTVASLGTMVGAAAPRASGGTVAAVTTGFVGLDDSGAETHRIDCLSEGIRMNDAKTDPAGRYWAGSCAMDFEAGLGGLWRLDEDWNAELVLPNLTQPNGMGWSPDGRTYYLVETQDRRILSFPFDPETSTLTPTPTELVGPGAFDHFPDGLAVDARGHLWVAEFAGAAVHEFAPDGTLLRSIGMPTAQPTSCAFIGPDLDQLWVTSAAAGIEEADDADAGSIYSISGHGTSGLPTLPFRG